LLGKSGTGQPGKAYDYLITAELPDQATVGQVSVGDMVYDRKEQLEQIRSGLLEGEKVIAVYDAVGVGTGFLGLTDRRVIVQDKSFVGKKVALTSIPYSKITSVSVVSNKSWAGSFFSSGSIAINVGTHVYEMEFRGHQKSHHVHNVILHYITQR
jgi:Bacterial PH domain